jgi:NADH:ubiquinone oxidoreductase subunit K
MRLFRRTQARHPKQFPNPKSETLLDGQIFAIFVIVLAAVALAIFLSFYNNLSTIDVERTKNLKG